MQSSSMVGRKYRKTRQLILARLARGPARAVEFETELEIDMAQAVRALAKLIAAGHVLKTRLVFRGVHGGTVAAIYQLSTPRSQA